MAAATLVLDVPQKVTLEALLDDLRQVNVPAGTRYIEYRSAALWYYEIDSGQADAGATTPAAQQAIDAGTSSFRCPESGSGRARLTRQIELFLVGSVASQEIWLTATSRAP